MNHFTITLTEQELNVVADALGNMPYVRVAAVVNKIQQQVAMHQQINQQAPVTNVPPAAANGSSAAQGPDPV